MKVCRVKLSTGFTDQSCTGLVQQLAVLVFFCTTVACLISCYHLTVTLRKCFSTELHTVMDFDYKIFSQTVKHKQRATDELRSALASLMNSKQRFTAAYVVPSTTVLICGHAPGALCVVDTHPVPKRCGGIGRRGVIVASRNTASAITAVSDWLMMRLWEDDELTHEMAVVTAFSAKRTSAYVATPEIAVSNCGRGK